MPILAIMNYETAKIELIHLSSATSKQYSGDFDKLVFNKMGYKQTSVYYMVAEDIDIIKKEE